MSRRRRSWPQPGSNDGACCEHRIYKESVMSISCAHMSRATPEQLSAVHAGRCQPLAVPGPDCQWRTPAGRPPVGALRRPQCARPPVMASPGTVLPGRCRPATGPSESSGGYSLLSHRVTCRRLRRGSRGTAAPQRTRTGNIHTTRAIEWYSACSLPTQRST